MPGSVGVFDDIFAEHLETLQPQKILDVGMGAGKYGFIIRNVLPECEIHGIEPESQYIERYNLSGMYDKIFNKSIQSFIREDMNYGEQYDLVICGDVLEHLFLSEVHDVLDFFSYRCKWFIAQFPSNVPQFAEHDVVWEVHRSNLQLKDFLKYNVIYYNSMRETDKQYFVGQDKIVHQYLILGMLLNIECAGVVQLDRTTAF